MTTVGHLKTGCIDHELGGVVGGRLMFMGGGGLLLLVRVMVWCGGEGSIVCFMAVFND